MRTIFWIAALLLRTPLGLPAEAGPSPSPRQVLSRAAGATHRVAYRGTRLTVLWLHHGEERVESVEYADGHGRVRIEYQGPSAAKGRVVVDDGKRCWQIEPNGRSVFLSPSRDEEGEAHWDVDHLLSNYRVTLDPAPQRVARRPAYCLALVPRHRGKMQRRLWIDTQTYLVLRNEAFHFNGSPARITGFAKIDLRPTLTDALFRYTPAPTTRIVRATAALQWVDAAAAARFIGARASFPAAIPSLGFRLHGALCREESGKRRLQLLYEDGIATASVFVDRDTRGIAIKGGRSVTVNGRRGSLRVGGHFPVLRWAAGGFRYVAMADLSTSALLRLARDFH